MGDFSHRNLFTLPDIPVKPNEIAPTLISSTDSKASLVNAIDKSLRSYTELVEATAGTVWMDLQYDRAYLVTEVVLHQIFYTNFYWPADACIASEEAFKACVDSYSGLLVEVYSNSVLAKQCNTPVLTYGLTEDEQINTFSCNAIGDKIRLSKSSGNIRVQEIVVFRDPRAGT